MVALEAAVVEAEEVLEEGAGEANPPLIIIIRSLAMLYVYDLIFLCVTEHLFIELGEVMHSC